MSLPKMRARGKSQLKHTNDLHSEGRLERSRKYQFGAVDDASGDTALRRAEGLRAVPLARATGEDLKSSFARP
jgi:hypothetical protein